MSNQELTNIINEIISKLETTHFDIKDIEGLINKALQYQLAISNKVSDIKNDIADIEDLIDLMEDERL